jgi:predicted MFS family arabinose efflux permease
VSASTFAFGIGGTAAAFGLGPVARAAGYPLIYVIAAGCGAVAAALVWWSPENAKRTGEWTASPMSRS